MLTRRYQDEKNVHQTSAVMKIKSVSVKYMYKYLINTLQNPISTCMFYLTYMFNFYVLVNHTYNS